MGVINLLVCKKDFVGNFSFLATTSRLNLKSNAVFVCILYFFERWYYIYYDALQGVGR